MVRRVVTGALTFGLTGLVAGYIWVAWEFPFAIAVPAAVGVFALVRPDFESRRAWVASAMAAITFTGAFLFAVFLALTDAATFSPPAWFGALAAAFIAGAATGTVLAGGRGALVVGGYSAVGMVGGIAVMALMRAAAPASIDVAGAAQNAYFAVAIGLVGACMGAALGAAVAYLASRGTATS